MLALAAAPAARAADRGSTWLQSRSWQNSYGDIRLLSDCIVAVDVIASAQAIPAVLALGACAGGVCDCAGAADSLRVRFEHPVELCLLRAPPTGLDS